MIYSVAHTPALRVVSLTPTCSESGGFAVLSRGHARGGCMGWSRSAAPQRPRSLCILHGLELVVVDCVLSGRQRMQRSTAQVGEEC